MSQLMLVNPKRRKRRAKRTPTMGYTVGNAPIRRRKLNPKRRRRAVARKSVRRVRRRSRANPKFSIRSIQRQALMPAAIGGVGALALDVAFGMLPIPAQFKTGAMGSVAKLAGAIVLGKIAGKVAGARVGEAVTVGAVTIQAYNLVKGFAQKAMPSLPMGEYLSGMYGPNPGLGYTNAAIYGGSQPILPYSGNDAGDAPMNVGEYLSDYSGNYSYSY